MIKRKSYDTRLKYLAREGLLPDMYRRNIPRSLICKWKQEPKEKYVGYELNENIEQLYELMKVVGEDQRLQKAVRAMLRINKTLKDIIGKGAEYISKIREHKTHVVKTIQRAGETISIAKASKIMGISRSTFRAWSLEEYYKCKHSLLKLCSNTYPQQLTYKEIKRMHDLLSDARFITWPINSVAYYGIKHNIVKAHPSTWYKYSRLMNIKRLRYKKRKRVYEEGVRATRPNQKWHADITELLLRNGQIAYIYLVIDNYSRLILSWRIADKICGKIRTETFREAVLISKIRKYKQKRKRITQLIVDGGSENNNKTVSEFINKKSTPLKKVIALKDIFKSNAMIEYTNRVVKYEYLFPQPSYDMPQLFRTMQKTVFDYNSVRPQGVLKGLTPIEAHTGMKVNLKFESRLMREAMFDRVNWNQGHNCKGCPFGCSN